jgi:hypothetical protein
MRGRRLEKNEDVFYDTRPPQALSHPPVPASAKTDAFANGRAPSRGNTLRIFSSRERRRCLVDRLPQ